MDRRKYMSDREILKKYIGLSNTCLHKDEKEKGRSYGYVIQIQGCIQFKT